ncbi:MAG: hypothetical protein JF627_00865 [Alphaproteobacteria bacterium]|nr:hypothetical protein [Alphaproteobacteria bacterium]
MSDKVYRKRRRLLICFDPFGCCEASTDSVATGFLIHVRFNQKRSFALSSPNVRFAPKADIPPIITDDFN